MTDTLAGLPIIGTPSRYTQQQKEQRSQEELEILLTEVWDNPGMDMIECIMWDQYTPMFNDGDACIFGSNDAHLIPKEVHDQWDLDYGYPHPEDSDNGEDYGISQWHISDYMVGAYPKYAKYRVLEPALKAIGNICSGEFDVVLNSLFGDPARVVVYRDRIVIDEYFDTPY